MKRGNFNGVKSYQAGYRLDMRKLSSLFVR